MDAAVGRLVDTLRAVGALDNTLVSRFLLEGKYLLIVLIIITHCLFFCFHNHSSIVLIFNRLLIYLIFSRYFSPPTMGLEVYHRAKVRYCFKRFEIAKSHIGPAPLISLALNMHLMRIILFPQIFDISISNC